MIDKERLHNIKQLVKDGRSDLVSQDQRQWVLDQYRNNNIPVPQSVYTVAQQLGYDVEGLVVAKD